MFPASTNGDYQGAAFSWQVLLVIAPLLLLSGLSHLVSQDVSSAALASEGLADPEVTHLTAVQGTFELALAVFYLLVVVRYRSFVPVALLIEGVRQALNQLVFWFLAPPEAGVPEEPGVLRALFVGVTVIVFVALVLSAPRRARAHGPQTS
jgi:hypothetical protein